MLKIKYIPFGRATGLEIRDENGQHIFNLLPPGQIYASNYLVDNFFTLDCQFTYEELMEAIHKLLESRHDD